MLNFPNNASIYLCAQAVDLRKSFDGLSGLVESVFQRNVLDGHLFLFVNKRRDRIKALWWDRDGRVLWYKKLEPEDTQMFVFTEIGRAAHNQYVGLAEAGRMVRISRKSGPRRSLMPRQGSLSAPPRARRQREAFRSNNSGRS